MKGINIKLNLNLIYVCAKLFPQGIENSFRILKSKVLTRKS